MTQPRAVPAALRDLNQWVLWRFEECKGKSTRVPYRADHRRASASDSSTWRPHGDANCEALVGFTTAPSGAIVGTTDTQILTNKTMDTAGGNTLKVAGTSLASIQGNTTKVQMATGTPTSGHCADFDANGNVQDAGATCATGGGLPLQYGADSGSTTDAYVISAPGGFSQTTGATVYMTTTRNNSGSSPTLQVGTNSAAAINVCGTGSNARAGDITATNFGNVQVYQFTFNGTAWNLANPFNTNCPSVAGNFSMARLQSLNYTSTSGLGIEGIFGDSGYISNHTALIAATVLAANQGGANELWQVVCTSEVHTSGAGTLTFTIGWTNPNGVASTATIAGPTLTQSPGAVTSLTSSGVYLNVGPGNMTYSTNATTGSWDGRCIAKRGA